MLPPGAGVTWGVSEDRGGHGVDRDVGSWSSEGPKLQWRGGGREAEEHQFKRRPERKTNLSFIKKPKLVQIPEGPWGTAQAHPLSTRGCRVGPDPQHPQGRSGRHSHPRQWGTRHRQVKGGAWQPPQQKRVN